MATINLRPWREEQSSLRQKQFGANVIGSIVFAVIVVFLVGYYFDSMKNRQIERNSYLNSEIAKLDKQIEEIKELKLKRERLLERLTAIQQLQGSRPLIVRNFDELVRVLPDGAYYSSLSRKGDKVAITGMAENNQDVSSLMRNINQSIWFSEPLLSSVDASKGSNTKKIFKLSVGVVKPKADKADKIEGK